MSHRIESKAVIIWLFIQFIVINSAASQSSIKLPKSYQQLKSFKQAEVIFQNVTEEMIKEEATFMIRFELTIPTSFIAGIYNPYDIFEKKLIFEKGTKTDSIHDTWGNYKIPGIYKIVILDPKGNTDTPLIRSLSIFTGSKHEVKNLSKYRLIGYWEVTPPKHGTKFTCKYELLRPSKVKRQVLRSGSPDPIWQENRGIEGSGLYDDYIWKGVDNQNMNVDPGTYRLTLHAKDVDEHFRQQTEQVTREFP